MVLGTREKTPTEVQDAFIASGTMHVFAVSGLHVVLFFGIMLSLLRMVRLRPGWILGIALPVMFFYVFITGLRPSAWRAAIMAAAVFSAPLFNRESNLFNNLGLAALLLLGCDTEQLFQPGFTLSFGVLLALAILHPVMLRWMRPLCELDPFLPRELYKSSQKAWLWVRRFIVSSVSVSLASTIGSAFLMIYYFRLFTPVGIVSNLFLVALSEGILIVACASLATAGLGLSLLSTLFNHCNWLLAFSSVKTAQFFAAVPGGHFQVDPSRLWRGDLCEVTVLSVESGAAVHIDTPGGKHWLIDTGGRRHFTRTVRPHLLRTPVNRLDGMLISHTDTYHSGAAGEVRRVFQPVEHPSLTAGDEITIESGVRLRCLFPPAGWKAGASDNRCAVFLLECRGTRILLTNDAGFVTEKALLASGEDLRADILIKGQNTADYSGLPEFINAVHPQTVIFTNNIFPSGESVQEEWKAMLRRKGISFFDQSQSGAVIIRIEPESSSARGFCDAKEIKLKARPSPEPAPTPRSSTPPP
jgi:ComEC/Rec2-related protein